MDDTPFLVRPNLHEYLKLVRSERTFCWLFIDAICINQDDNAEKSTQISLMSRIYGDAQQVQAWVGVEPITGYEDQPAMARYFEGSLDMNDLNEEQQKDLLYYFIPWSYWSRLWIAQEVMLARNLVIRFRNITLKADLALSLLTEKFPNPSVRTAILTNSRQLRPERYGRGDHATSGLLLAYYFLYSRQKLHEDPMQVGMAIDRAVVMLSGQDCSRRYDKIFGLLGLTRSQLNADYEMNVIELYLRILIEGRVSLIVHDPNRKSEEEELHFFRKCLLLSLQISPWHPVVALVTMKAVKLNPSGVHSSWVDPLDYAFSAVDPIFDEGHLDCSWTAWPKEIFWLIKSITKSCILTWQIRRWRTTGARLKGPEDKESGLTVNEWMKMVERIYEDVSGQVYENHWIHEWNEELERDIQEGFTRSLEPRSLYHRRS